MPETRKIVFLGASFAGLAASHYFLKHIYPTLPADGKVRYEAVIISPSTALYARPSAPLTAVRPDILPTETMFPDVRPGYKQYGDKVQFIQGKATAWNDKSREIVIEHADGSKQTMSYWALVVATGTRTPTMWHGLQGDSHEGVMQSLRDVKPRLDSGSVKDIVIAGGGATAVETAGEFGHYLNGRAGWFQSEPSQPTAKITLITSGSRLLPALRPSIGEEAETYLRSVGVYVRYNTKVSSSADEASKTRVTLHDGEELETDMYVAAVGVTPMSEWIPAHLKDSKGYVMQDAKTLRVDAAGSRVYALGDIGTASDNTFLPVMNGVAVLGTNIQRDLQAAHNNPAAKPNGPDREYKPLGKEMQLVPIGRSKGVGAVMGFKVPSWFVWLLKGRNYTIIKPEVLASGANYAKESKWKGA